ncbi:universal stress protein [Ochrobactrum soli]|uniref:Universal stress protein n=2 Tax=Ochrobactrum TaxID=528 RepID=A0ABY2Y8Z6_9HYPH|nr:MULTISPECIES: universal stress protein [Brucella]MCI0999529.1 universal stress protein [Ochrobactrum sp. C6C9]RRD27870.1 universal stress protein [Brucellaceae bacterium VT-16-1752]WHT41274.1 universal stress protein [Ochrobactrum sp. SSR]MDX4075621.1 universal stress protein [Brucella sp. NBRC 113783]RLL75177.1 universal stress protein [[Ochrobactrum] soli]
MVSKRLSRESGHRRKFLAVIDETPECGRAVAYAARRAKNTSGSLILLFVIDDSDFQQILGVGEIMRAEAQDRARSALEKFAAVVREDQGIEPELSIREGQTAEELLSLIEEDQDIAILVLAAGSGKEGPGPLVQSLAGRAQFPIPVTVVPAGLTDDDIDAVT